MGGDGARAEDPVDHAGGPAIPLQPVVEAGVAQQITRRCEEAWQVVVWAPLLRLPLMSSANAGAIGSRSSSP